MTTRRPDQMRGSALPLLLVLAAALAGSATESRAQQARVDLLAGRTADARGGSLVGVTVAPSLAWAGPGAAVAIGARATRFASGSLQGLGSAWGRVALTGRGPVRLVVDGEGWAGGSDTRYRAMGGATRARLRLARGGWSVEAGPELAAARDRSDTPAPVGGRPGALGGLLPERAVDPQGWSARLERGWSASASLQRGPGALASGWRTWRTSAERSMEGSVEGSVAIRSVLLAGSVGARGGPATERWAAGRVVVRTGRGAAVVAEAGRSPSSTLTGRPGGDYATVGLRLATAQAGGK